MNFPSDSLTVFVSMVLYHLAWGLLHSIWIITVLAAIYGVFRLMVPRRWAKVRYCFGYAILLAMLVLTAISCFYVGISFPKPQSPISVAENRVEPPQEQPETLAVQEFSDEKDEKEDENDQETALRNEIRARFLELLRKSAPSSVSELETVDETPVETLVSYDVAETEKPFDTIYSSTWTVFETICGKAHVYLPFAAIAWMLGVVIFSSRLCCDWFTLRRIRKNALFVEDGLWYDRLELLGERIGLVSKIRLAASEHLDSPILVGFFKPMILIPLSLLTGFTPSEIDVILSHELVHVRRHDHLANLVQLIIETLLFYHPLLWWVSRRVRFERENICDDLVVKLAENAPLIYVKTLVRLEEIRIDFYGGTPMKTTKKNTIFSRSESTLAALSKPLLSRVHRILGTPDPNLRRANWIAGAILLSVFILTPLILFLCRFSPNLQAEGNTAQVTKAEPPSAAPPMGMEATSPAEMGMGVMMFAPAEIGFRQTGMVAPPGMGMGQAPGGTGMGGMGGGMGMGGPMPQPPGGMGQGGGMIGGMGGSGMGGMSGSARTQPLGGMGMGGGGMGNAGEHKTVARAYSLKKLKDLSGYAQAERAVKQANSEYNATSAEEKEFNESEVAKQAFAQYNKMRSLFDEETKTREAFHEFKAAEQRQKTIRERTQNAEDALSHANDLFITSMEIYNTCEQMLMDSLPKEIKTYSIARNGAIVIVALPQVHETVPEKIKQVEEICESLLKLRDENTKDASSAASDLNPNTPSQETKTDAVAPLLMRMNPGAQSEKSTQEPAKDLPEDAHALAPWLETKTITTAPPKMNPGTPSEKSTQEPAINQQQPIPTPQLIKGVPAGGFPSRTVTQEQNPQRGAVMYKVQDAPAEKPTIQEDIVDRVEKALELNVEIKPGEFNSLSGVIEQIREQTSVYVRIDPDSALDENTDLQTPINYKEATASTLLDRVLQQFSATYTITGNGDVVIIGLDMEEAHTLIRLYDVREKGGNMLLSSLTSLYPTIVVAPVGEGVLAIQAPYQTHRQIRRFINSLPKQTYRVAVPSGQALNPSSGW